MDFAHLINSTVISVYFAAIGIILLVVAKWIIDKVTPGDLAKQIVPVDSNAQPNVALAVLVGSMLIGISIIIASAIN